MSRIEGKFIELREKGKKALITFITAGDPDLATTKRLVEEMEARGADIIELGIPYSDPIAEGPVIQKANIRALLHSIRTRDIIDLVAELRNSVKVPIVFLLYFNCIFKYGVEKFFSDCESAGVDGLIIPDLPYEERSELEDTADRFGIDLITMVAPTSRDRIERIAKSAKGFLYCVSSLGVTGVRERFDTDFNDFFSSINKYSNIPKALGFGISTSQHIKELRGYCDGLIVGSAIVRKVEESVSGIDAVKNVGEYVQTLRRALDE